MTTGEASAGLALVLALAGIIQKALLGDDAFRKAFDIALKDILADIRQDLEEFGVRYDEWFSERSLSDGGAIDRALERLRSNGVVYEKDGAQWFRATDFGDEKDRVVVRENGIKTYFASDIAYHLQKRERGFEQLLDVLGADHHGYIARVRAGLVAMGVDAAGMVSLPAVMGDALEALRIVAILAGAVITENVFGWKGMGQLFNQALNNYDLNLFIGVFMITSILTVLANLVADLLFGVVDPRIRIRK